MTFELDQRDWLLLGRAYYGPDTIKWAFRCSRCKSSQTAQEALEKGHGQSDAYTKCFKLCPLGPDGIEGRDHPLLVVLVTLDDKGRADKRYEVPAFGFAHERFPAWLKLAQAGEKTIDELIKGEDP